MVGAVRPQPLSLAQDLTKKTDSESDASTLVERLEADLLAGRFRPGEWLKQADIESTYRANRFDVRMALVDLKVRKLIEHVKNRGFRVLNLTAIEREQLLETRTIVETAAARMAAVRASSEDIAELRTLAEKFGGGIETASLDDLRLWNSLFHERLYALSGNAVLAAEIQALRQRGIPGSANDGGVWRTVGGLARSHEDHMQMLQLLEERNAEGLATLVDCHINRTRELFAKSASQDS